MVDEMTTLISGEIASSSLVTAHDDIAASISEQPASVSEEEPQPSVTNTEQSETNLDAPATESAVHEELPPVQYPSKEGTMTKQSGAHKKWKERWFVLKDNTLRFYNPKSVRIIHMNRNLIQL